MCIKTSYSFPSSKVVEKNKKEVAKQGFHQNIFGKIKKNLKLFYLSAYLRVDNVSS